MSETLEYHEILPPQHLAGVIRCIWRLRGAQPAELAPEPIVPDGCVEIVLNLGDPFSRHVPDGATQRQTPRLVAGQITRGHDRAARSNRPLGHSLPPLERAGLSRTIRRQVERSLFFAR